MSLTELVLTHVSPELLTKNKEPFASKENGTKNFSHLIKLEDIFGFGVTLWELWNTPKEWELWIEECNADKRTGNKITLALLKGD